MWQWTHTIDNYWTAINQSDSSITIQEILTVLSMLRWSDSGIRESWVFWVFKHQNHHKRQTCTCARCPISSPTWFTSTSVGTLCVGTISVAVAVTSVVTTLVDICLTIEYIRWAIKTGLNFIPTLPPSTLWLSFDVIWLHLASNKRRSSWQCRRAEIERELSLGMQNQSTSNRHWLALTSVFVQIEIHTFYKAGPPVSKWKRGLESNIFNDRAISLTFRLQSFKTLA